MKPPAQPELLAEPDAPEEVFVRFDEALPFLERLAAEGRVCVSQTVDRKRHGYECLVMRKPEPK